MLTAELSRFLFRLIWAENDFKDLPDSFFTSYQSDLRLLSETLLHIPEVVEKALSWKDACVPLVLLGKITTASALEGPAEDLLEEPAPKEETEATGDEKKNDKKAPSLEIEKALRANQVLLALETLYREQEKAHPNEQLIAEKVAALRLRRKVLPSLFKLAEQAFHAKTISSKQYKTLSALGQKMSQKEKTLVKHYSPLLSSGATNLARLERKPFKASADDLFQESFFGLLYAAELYSPATGAAFLTYVRPWLFATMSNTLVENSPIRLPPRLYSVLKALYKERSRHQIEQGCFPTKEELAETFGLTEKQINWHLQVPIFPYSLEAPLAPYSNEGGPRPLSDELSSKPPFIDSLKNREGTPEHSLATQEKEALLKNLLKELPNRNRLVLEGFFYKENQAEAIATKIPSCKGAPVSHSRLYQLREKSLEKLRTSIKIRRLAKELRP